MIALKNVLLVTGLAMICAAPALGDTLIDNDCDGGTAYFGLRSDGANVGQGQSITVTERSVITHVEFEFVIPSGPSSGIDPLGPGDLISFQVQHFGGGWITGTAAPVPGTPGPHWIDFDLPLLGPVLEPGQYQLLAVTVYPRYASVTFCPDGDPYPGGDRFASLNGIAGPWFSHADDLAFRVYGYHVPSSEQLDQQQADIDYGFWFDVDETRWQEFAPTFSNLSAVELNIQRNGDPGSHVVMEIRTRDGQYVASRSRIASDIPYGSSWVLFDMNLVLLDPNQIYRIHVSSTEASPSPEHRYFWRGTTSSTYNPACENSINGWPDFDFAFRTFGYPVILDTPDTPRELVRPGLVLHPNYPDPFNPLTTLRFELPQDADARLAVYDLQGRLVKTLASEFLTAGVHERRWDGRDEGGRRVASGVYYGRLSAGEAAVIEKLVLVK